MFRTSISYLASHLQKTLFDNRPRSVVYAEGEAYFQKLKENRLDLPGLAFSLTQCSLRHGPSKPTRFRLDDNAGGTKALVLNLKPAILTFAGTFYCRDMLESFDFIQKYYELEATQGVVEVKYNTTDANNICLDSNLHSFEEPTAPPNAGARSQDYDSAGLIYTLDIGFSFNTVFLVSSEEKLIRCISYNLVFSSVDDAKNAYYINEEVTNVKGDIDG